MVSGGTSGKWADVLWLAGQDIRRDVMGYLTSGLYMLGLGALLAPGIGFDSEIWGPEIAFIALTFIMTQPFFSRDYMSWDNDRVAARLTFQRIMPIPVDVIVGSRMLALIAAGAVNIPAFFLPIYLFGEWPIGAWTYGAFVAFWVGVSLLGTGYGLWMEMGVSVRRYTITNLVVVLLAIALLSLVGAAGGFWPVRRSVELVAEHPVLMAVVGMAVGIGGYLVLGRMAVDRLRQRELTP